MDPDAYLRACRRLAAQLIEDADRRSQHYESQTVDTKGEELAENFRNLDEWISKGGALPAAWRKE